MHGQKIKATCAGIQDRVADDQDSAELTCKSFSFILILYFSCVLDIWLASDRPIWRARSSSSSMPALSPVAWHLRVCERHVGAGKLQAKNLVDTFEHRNQEHSRGSLPSLYSFAASRTLSSLPALLTCRDDLHVLPLIGNSLYAVV